MLSISEITSYIIQLCIPFYTSSRNINKSLFAQTYTERSIAGSTWCKLLRALSST